MLRETQVMEQSSSTAMSLPEVGEENQLAIMEKLVEQEIKEIKKIYEKIIAPINLLDEFFISIVQQPNLETYADRVTKIAEEKFADLYVDLKLEVLEKWRLKALNDISSADKKMKPFSILWNEFKMLQMYDEAIAEMKRKSKMKKGSHSSFKIIDIDGENEAIDGDTEIRIHKKHPIKDNTKKGSHSSSKVINIEGEKEAIDGDPEIRIHKKHPIQDNTVLATLGGVQMAIVSSLGSPFKDPKWESNGNVMLIDFVKAVHAYAPCMALSAMLLMSSIYATTLTRPLPFRWHANLMQMLLLMYYILAVAEALSGCGVVIWGSTQVPALMFVFGGAIGPMLLMGSIIMGVKYCFEQVSL